jgi:hypothetical protein
LPTNESFLSHNIRNTFFKQRGLKEIKTTPSREKLPFCAMLVEPSCVK